MPTLGGASADQFLKKRWTSQLPRTLLPYPCPRRIDFLSRKHPSRPPPAGADSFPLFFFQCEQEGAQLVGIACESEHVRMMEWETSVVGDDGDPLPGHNRDEVVAGQEPWLIL